jgi:hypothetical protein
VGFAGSLRLQQCPMGFAAKQHLGHKQLAAGARWPRTMILRGGLVGSVNDPPRLHHDVKLYICFFNKGRTRHTKVSLGEKTVSTY